MKSNEYHFVTTWRVKSTLEEVNAIIGDATGLTRWWPSVYLEVRELAPDNTDTHTGRVISLFTKGWLPYTLRWQFTVTQDKSPHGFALLATGDFAGRGEWTFTQDGEYVSIVYDWRVDAEKALLKHLSFVMKPIFSANHHWAMARGEESLRLELQRRHARTQAERDAVPAPTGPTFAWLLPRAPAAV